MKQIIFYKSSSGKEIITIFIDKLDLVTSARVRNALRLLEKHGLELMKNRTVKKISRNPDIYELRIVGKKQVRLLFSTFKGNIYLICHIFIKKIKTTPKKEIERAKKRVKEFI